MAIPSSAVPHEFTPAGYGAMIEALLTRGYGVTGFAEARPERRHLILRHDIDVSIEAALEMAQVEARLGVSSSYFVLLRSPLYNPLDPDNLDALCRLRALGHAIGLHLDAALYDGAALDEAAARECGILEAMLAQPVTLISFHRPAPALLGRAGKIAGRVHAYQPRFFREMGYCSDSGGAWRHGAPLDHPAVGAGRGLQLLTHPVWWTGGGARDIAQRLERFLDERRARLAAALAAGIDAYRERLSE